MVGPTDQIQIDKKELEESMSNLGILVNIVPHLLRRFSEVLIYVDKR